MSWSGSSLVCSDRSCHLVEWSMVKKQVHSKPKAQSAMGPIAHALIQGYLGPDQRVTNMERFFTALMRALHDAYALGWKDRGEIE